MTASRLKRLRTLEQRKRKEAEDMTSRAMDRLTPGEAAALGSYFEGQGTPEGQVAVSRLLAWGNTVPEVKGAADLGSEAAAWWKRLEEPGGLLPVASPETLEQLRQYAEQWREVAARPDCPEPEAARGIWGMWTYWAALALESRGTAAEAPDF